MRSQLFSIEIIAGSRTYCFYVRKSVDGNKYIVIIELQDGVEKGQIMIFEEYFQDFRKGYRKAIRFVKKDNQELYYPRTYDTWSKGEEYNLMNLWAHNKTIQEIADKLKRGLGAIRSRLKKLDKLKLL